MLKGYNGNTLLWELAGLFYAALVLYVLNLARRVRLLENWKKVRQEVQDQQMVKAISKLTNIAEHQQQVMDRTENVHIQ